MNDSSTVNSVTYLKYLEIIVSKRSPTVPLNPQNFLILRPPKLWTKFPPLLIPINL